MMETTHVTQPRVLPARVRRDCAGKWFANGAIVNGDIPYCVVGHALALDHDSEDQFTRVKYALRMIGLGIAANDRAVIRINERRGNPSRTARVPFSDWCAELNVVRGE